MKLKDIFSIKNNFENTHKIINICGIKFKFKRRYSKKDYIEYIEWLSRDDENNFVKYETLPATSTSIKLIAFYLPQFHLFEENDLWHGKGFTEWRNVTSSIPIFAGHNQPQMPADLGFYDLDNIETFEKQIEIAKNYGIYGFSFYYYWFQGKKLMERPIYNFLKHKNLNFPFCLCWACENWSKLWDGGNKEVLMHFDFLEKDIDSWWSDILPFLEDERYIKINNKPLIQIYSGFKIKQEVFNIFIKKIEEKAKAKGFDGVYATFIISTHTLKNKENIHKYENIKGYVEFFPSCFKLEKKLLKVNYKLPYFNGKIFDFPKTISNFKRPIEPIFENVKIFRGCFTAWDNSARKARTGANIFHGTTPKLYFKWLKQIITWTKNNLEKEEQFVFINAWNEWAEGAHLEPDKKFGYAYLKATKKALEETK